MNAVRPKILRGAFMESGLSVPPLVVVFQYNPMQLTRNRTLSFEPPAMPAPRRTIKQPDPTPPEPRNLRDFHGRSEFTDLEHLRQNQIVKVSEPTIAFDIRLDATDQLNDGDAVTEATGIGPQLSTLELMVYPKEEGLLGAVAGPLLNLLGASPTYNYPRRPNPPMILFIFGRQRVLPVNINAMNITETEFSADLNPTRATVSVQLTVIEGQSPAFTYSQLMTETMSLLNLRTVTDVANVIIPG